MTTYSETRPPGATTLVVGGMTCAGCARTIERMLSRVSGVERAAVDFDLGIAIIYGSAAPAALVAAVEAAGYGASSTAESNKEKEQ